MNVLIAVGVAIVIVYAISVLRNTLKERGKRLAELRHAAEVRAEIERDTYWTRRFREYVFWLSTGSQYARLKAIASLERLAIERLESGIALGKEEAKAAGSALAAFIKLCEEEMDLVYPESYRTAPVDLVAALLAIGRINAVKAVFIEKLDLNLRKVDLRDQSLEHIYGFGLDLREANLSGANLSGAYLREVNLREANLNQTNLTGAQIIFAFIDQTQMAGTNLTNALLAHASFNGVDLSTTNLTNTNWDESVHWPEGSEPNYYDWHKHSADNQN
jgi:hypothetical protein